MSAQISVLNERIPDFARDIRLNLDSVLTAEGAPGLAPGQIAAVALACAYAVESEELASAVLADHAGSLAPEAVTAAKGAAALMAMNNVYYRFLHLAEDKAFGKLPARLRMNLIGKPGVPKVDFELMSLAVSAISGCGACINSHVHEVRKGGVSDEGIQSAVRIGAVIQAASRSLAIAKIAAFGS
jgi:alkyl hydroperoxide reductase subunit D